MEKGLFEGNLVSTKRILYTPSAFARSSLLYLQETGSLKVEKPHTSSRRNLASYLFFLVTDGSGSLDYQNNHYHLEQGDCIFIDCSIPYSQYSSEDHFWSLAWAHFNGSTMPVIYQKFVERSGVPVFHAENISSFQDCLDQLYRTASSESYIRDMKINTILSSLLSLIMKDCYSSRGRKKDTKQNRLAPVALYLEANYSEKITLEQLSSLFYINKYYLTRIFKEQYGITINEYLLQVRITHTKQLLRFTDKTLDSIAAECGLSDGAYLSRMFKKEEGISPGKFRKSWRN